MNHPKKQLQTITQPVNNNYRNLIIMYSDILIRSLISFFLVGVLFAIVLVGFFHISFIIILPIVFLISILISPYLMKIRIGEKLISCYEDFLRKTFKLEND